MPDTMRTSFKLAAAETGWCQSQLNVWICASANAYPRSAEPGVRACMAHETVWYEREPPARQVARCALLNSYRMVNRTCTPTHSSASVACIVVLARGAQQPVWRSMVLAVLAWA